MRLNQFIAQATGMSRRQADTVISDGRIQINGVTATFGQSFSENDNVTLDNEPLARNIVMATIILHKPVGYVCSRNGQGSKTVYDLLPESLHHLKPVGRLDKDSSGLLVMTNDGNLANELTHPRYVKEKVYELTLNKPLKPQDLEHITTDGVKLEDGASRLKLELLQPELRNHWKVTMTEGRNRQIRRTFEALGYRVNKLHRIQFGSYTLGKLPSGQHQQA